MPPKFDRDFKGHNPERREIPTFSIDITGYWDTESRNENFITELRKLPFYDPNHLYCGFDALEPKIKGTIYCGTEESLNVSEEVLNNPIDYAFKRSSPSKSGKIAVYDQNKMRNDHTSDESKFEIVSDKALIAVIFILDNTK